jgi:organic radical activating enzyme
MWLPLVRCESWNAELHPPTGIDLIVQNASKYAETVVVTGGEPLMWDMSLLTNKLKVGRKVHIETSGAYPLSGTWDWICLSPKKTNYQPRRCTMQPMN